MSFCLITTASSGSWSIPKGTIERGNSSVDTALQEALEEAGLQGAIVGLLGTYEYRKYGVLLTVDVHLMEVRTALARWEEQPYRRRCWVGAQRARQLLDRHPARDLLVEACRRLAV